MDNSSGVFILFYPSFTGIVFKKISAISYQLSAISYQLSAISFVSFSMFILYNFFNIGFAPNLLNISSNTQYLECFFIGILAAFVNFTNFKSRFINQKTVFMLWLVLIASLLFISKSGILISGNETLYHLRSLTVIYAVIFGLTIIYISRNQINFLSNKFFVYTGKIGFSLYLLHFPVISIVNKMGLSNYTTLNFVISMLVVYLLSTYTFKYVELPFIKYANSK